VPWDQLSDDESESDENNSTAITIPMPILNHRTEVDQIINSINESITQLLRLSAAVRNPASHDRWLVSRTVDTSAYEPFDISHVREKFPMLHLSIAERLGIANSRRRAFFKYCQEHRNRLSAGLGTSKENDAESTIASSLPERAKKRDFDQTINDDDESNSGFTATSLATSLANATTLRAPPLPPETSYDEPFECPFCYGMIEVSNRSMWK
jgi:hypothetical protein